MDLDLNPDLLDNFKNHKGDNWTIGRLDDLTIGEGNIVGKEPVIREGKKSHGTFFSSGQSGRAPAAEPDACIFLLCNHRPPAETGGQTEAKSRQYHSLIRVDRQRSNVGNVRRLVCFV